jgi:hypothetical protein
VAYVAGDRPSRSAGQAFPTLSSAPTGWGSATGFASVADRRALYGGPLAFLPATFVGTGAGGDPAVRLGQLRPPPPNAVPNRAERSNSSLSAPSPAISHYTAPLKRAAEATRTHGEVLNKTADAGLRSAARNNKATRLLTRPGRTS